jgi:hypothetical protein
MNSPRLPDDMPQWIDACCIMPYDHLKSSAEDAVMIYQREWMRSMIAAPQDFGHLPPFSHLGFDAEQ